MKLRLLIIVAALALLLSACSLAEDITPPPNYQSPTPGPTMSPLFPQAAPDLASGAAVYAEKCAPCHGEQGMGDGPMAAKLQKQPAAIGKPEIARQAAPANWYTVVTDGNINSFMPPFKDSLTDQQRWDVVAYSMSLGGSTSAQVEKGKTVFEANCINCHAPTGDGVQGVDFKDQARMSKLTQTDLAGVVDKGIGTMKGFGGLIAAEDEYAVAAYVRSFSVSVGVAAVVPSATPQASATAAEPTATLEGGTPAPSATPGPSETPAANGTPVASPTPAGSVTPTVAVGNITGKVTNGSGGQVPSTLKVVLHLFEHNPASKQFSEVGTQEAPVSTDGSYKFDQVQMPANRAFYSSVNYSGTDYQSDPAFAKDGVSSIDLPVTIYDTTTDKTGLTIDQAHVLLDYSKVGVVQVVEFLIISNPGNKAVVAAAKGGAVMEIALPKGYTNLQFDNGNLGERYLKTDNGFADTQAVAPGSGKYQLVFGVDMLLPKASLFGGQKFEVTQSILQKIGTLSILVPEGVTVEGENVAPGGLQDMGSGKKFQVYNVTGLDAGKTLQFTANGAPSTGAASSTAASSNSSQNIIIGIGAFGLVLIVAGVWLFLRERNKTAAEPDEAEDDEDEDEDESSQGDLVDAIIALDDQFKAGNIAEAAYKERRADLKARLARKS